MLILLGHAQSLSATAANGNAQQVQINTCSPMGANQSNNMTTATETIDALGVDALCDRLCAGESQTAIAESLGVGIATLSRWIAADPERSARVREARIAAARTFDEMAEAELRAAADPFALAKARELASHYRWKASKSNPREYGEKIEIDQKTTLTDLTEDQINARLARLINASGEAGIVGVIGGKEAP